MAGRVSSIYKSDTDVRSRSTPLPRLSHIAYLSLLSHHLYASCLCFFWTLIYPACFISASYPYHFLTLSMVYGSPFTTLRFSIPALHYATGILGLALFWDNGSLHSAHWVGFCFRISPALFCIMPSHGYGISDAITPSSDKSNE